MSDDNPGADEKTPKFFDVTTDPCDENPFPIQDCRRGIWQRATRRVEEELSKMTGFLAEGYKVRAENEYKRVMDETLRHGRPVTAFSMSPVLVPIYQLKFDSWAWRGLAAIATDADLPTYDRWLVSYANGWIDLINGRDWPGESKEILVDALQTVLQDRVGHWKSEARKHLRAQDELNESPVSAALPQSKTPCTSPLGQETKASAPPPVNAGSGKPDANGNSPADKPAALDGSPASGPVRTPRRVPDLATSLARIQLVEELASELAAVNLDVKGYCTVELLKAKHQNFALWKILDDTEIQEVVDGQEFRPKAFAEALVMRKYGLTSRETLKKDRQKLRTEQKKRSM